MPDERPPDARELGLNMTLAQVGVEMIAPLFVGLVIDHYAGTIPWFTLVGVVFGFLGGLTHIILLTRQQDAARRAKDKPPSGVP
jgi:F0F1-type ATP synthase assembly protein I